MKHNFVKFMPIVFALLALAIAGGSEVSVIF